MAFNKIIGVLGNPLRADKSAPTDGWIISLVCIIGPLREGVLTNKDEERMMSENNGSKKREA